MKENKEKNNARWLITIFITTFVISIFFSYISTTAINDIPIIPAILILILVIIIGIIFDIIGVSVTIAEEEEFHAKATKKITGAKTAVVLIRNAAKVANICADVIGDICGVLSGAISAIVAIKISATYNMSFPIQFLISAMVAAITVSGKALGKNIASKSNGKIVWAVAKIISPFRKEKNK